MFLKDSNVGIMGYGANLLTAATGAWAVQKFTKSTVAGESFLLGGIVMLAGRLIEDWFGRKVVEFASVGIPIPGMGADYAYDFRMMSGDFINQTFPLPYSSLPSGRHVPALPSPEAAAAAANGGGKALGLGSDSRTWQAWG
jgi:hypothetical protein